MPTAAQAPSFVSWPEAGPGSVVIACADAARAPAMRAWAALVMPGAAQTLASDARGWRQAAALAHPAVIEAHPDVLAAWRAPAGARSWVVLPRPEALGAALALKPGALLTLPLGLPLVAGSPVPTPGQPGWEALLDRARAGAAARGTHGRWLHELLRRGAEAPEHWPLLAPLLVEHAAWSDRKRWSSHRGQQPLPLEAHRLLAPVAWGGAWGALAQGVAIRLGPLEGTIHTAPGPALRLLEACLELLAGTLGPGGLLTLSAEGPHIRLARTPGDEPAPAHAPLSLARLEALAAKARARLSLDRAPWASLHLHFETPAVPVPVPTPRTVLLEPDPLLRAWVRNMPGGAAVAMPPWRPGEPVPAVGKGTLVVVDAAFEPGLALSPGFAGRLATAPLRERFANGARAKPAPAGPAPEAPPESQGLFGMLAGATTLLAAAGVTAWMLNPPPPVPPSEPPRPAKALAAAAWNPDHPPAPPPVKLRRQVVVSLASRTLVVKDGDQEIARFLITIGREGGETPAGEFRVTSVVPDPPFRRGAQSKKPYSQDPSNPLGTRWIGISAPGIGLHGTSDAQGLGAAASEGCLRLANRDVEALSMLVGPGTRVRIAR